MPFPVVCRRDSPRLRQQTVNAVLPAGESLYINLNPVWPTAVGDTGQRMQSPASVSYQV